MRSPHSSHELAVLPGQGPDSTAPAHSEHHRSQDTDSFGPDDTVKAGGAMPADTDPDPGHVEHQDQQREDVDDAGHPDGGLRAWLVVLGAWCAMFPSFGLINSYAVFQAYVAAHQLAHESAGSIGWIFSLNAFMCFFVGVFIGPVFDKYGPRGLIGAGSVLVVASLIALGFCTSLPHFIVVFGLVNGTGSALLFTPSIAAVAHFFRARRGFATGLATTGGGIGGIVIPLMLQHLFVQVGWAWATRVLALVCLVLVLIANGLLRARLPPDPAASAYPSARIFCANRTFALATAGIFFVEFALFVPLTYISAYAVARGFSTAFALRLVAILNAASVVGRVLPGWYADRIGAFRANMLAVVLAIVSLLGVWLPCSLVDGTKTSPEEGGDGKASAAAALVLYTLLFGFTSGCNINLIPVCIGQLCATAQYGRYYATCYTVVSFATLMGVPVAGHILTAAGGAYWGLIVFTAGLGNVAADPATINTTSIPPPTSTSSLELICTLPDRPIPFFDPSAGAGMAPPVDAALRKRVLKVIVFSLLLDLISFTFILPLFPSLLEFYRNAEAPPPDAADAAAAAHKPTLLATVLAYLHAYKAAFARPIDARYDIVLLGGALGSLFSLLQAVAAPVIGRLSDRHGRRTALLASMAGNVVSVLLWVVAVDFRTFLLSRVVGGLSEGNVQLAMAMAADVSDDARRGATMALVGACFSVAFTVGPALGAWLSTLSAIRANPFAAAAGVSLALVVVETVYLWVALPETRPPVTSPVAGTDAGGSSKGKDSKTTTTVKTAPRPPTNSHTLLNAVHFAFLLIFSGMEFSLPFMTYDLFGYGARQNGRLLSFVGLVASVLQGGVTRRLPPLLGVRVGVVACLAAFVLLGRLSSVGTLYLAAACLAATSATVVTGLNALSSFEAAAAERGGKLGVLRSWGQVGRGLGPLLFTSVYWWAGRGVAYGAGAGGMAVVCVVVFALLRSPPVVKTGETKSETKTKTKETKETKKTKKTQ